MFKKALKLIYPSTCVFCKKIVDEEGVLCSDCWSRLNFIQKPQCNLCSMPLKYKVSESDICPSCIRKRPLYKEARAVFVYDRFISKLIFHFKYYDKTFLAKLFSKLLQLHTKEFVEKFDIIVPVPLYKNRLIKRRYNQSALLSKMYGKYINKEFILDFLKRKKDTRPQVELKGKNRMNNLKSAFCINDKYLNNLKAYKNKKFLIIDDVMTTGTTVNECAKAFLKEGIKDVYALTIAKTVLQ